MQQVLAFESDLLEYGDLFEGSKVVEAKVAELVAAATEELDWVLEGGGAFAMIDEVKGRLVQSNAERVRAIEAGTRKVVGVNCFTETEPSPLTAAEGPRARPAGGGGGRAGGGGGGRAGGLGGGMGWSGVGADSGGFLRSRV